MSTSQRLWSTRLSLFIACALFASFGPQAGRAHSAAAPALGTWALQTPSPYQLRSISMVSPTDGWAVGFESYTANNNEDGSVILRWDGAAWNRVTSPTLQPLYTVKMITASDGWAAGKGGKLLHWDGSAWSANSCSSNCIDFYGLDFTAANDVWAVGYDTFGNAAIAHWDGSAWTQTSLVAQRRFRAVAALSPSDAWAVGRAGSTSPYSMLRAHWTGAAWSETTINNGDSGLNAVDILPGGAVWAVGGRYICAYNGSWTYTYTDYPILNGIEMLSASDGWIVGGSSSILSNSLGVILHYDGSDWSAVPNPATRTLLAIDMLSANEGWALGYAGNLLHYTNYKQVYLPFVVR